MLKPKSFLLIEIRHLLKQKWFWILRKWFFDKRKSHLLKRISSLKLQKSFLPAGSDICLSESRFSISKNHFGAGDWRGSAGKSQIWLLFWAGCEALVLLEELDFPDRWAIGGFENIQAKKLCLNGGEF